MGRDHSGAGAHARANRGGSNRARSTLRLPRAMEARSGHDRQAGIRVPGQGRWRSSHRRQAIAVCRDPLGVWCDDPETALAVWDDTIGTREDHAE